MKKIVFVLNPHSGKALIKNALLKIIQVFSEAGYDVTVYPTKAPLDGYEYLKKREGQYDVLVCSGGDGTLNEVVRAVLEYQGDKPPIGYIPSGSTNDFATIFQRTWCVRRSILRQESLFNVISEGQTVNARLIMWQRLVHLQRFHMRHRSI